MPWLPQDVESTGLQVSEQYWAGEGSCVTKRLPGIVGHTWSVWCQEDQPPAGTVCRLNRKGWVADVSKCHTVPDKMVKVLELSVGSRSQARCTVQTGTRCTQPAFWRPLTGVS